MDENKTIEKSFEKAMLLELTKDGDWLRTIELHLLTEEQEDVQVIQNFAG